MVVWRLRNTIDSAERVEHTGNAEDGITVDLMLQGRDDLMIRRVHAGNLLQSQLLRSIINMLILQHLVDESVVVVQLRS